MKKLLLLTAIFLFAALPLMAGRVSPETAQKAAQTFLNNNGAKSTQLTDLSEAADFANLYIFNANPGFVVMAADDCVQPILGYSFENTFVANDMPDNVRGWLQGYNDEIQHAIESKMKATSETAKLWKDLMEGNTKTGEATPIVGPLVQTTWNQNAPYNNLCPKRGSTRTVTGCVATAMAQVMKYWNHPAVGTGSNSYSWNSQTLSADFGSTTYEWANMTNKYNSNSTSAQKTAVATLMYHCGVSVNMNYNTSGNGGSSASTYNVMNALQTYFSYAPFMRYKSKDDYGDELWIDMLKKELNDGRPMQYRGSDAGGAGGHSFVCDGYDSDDNFHFNWGWGSYCDGYYSVNDMEPGVGGIGAGNGVYTVGQSAIFGIEPISDLQAPILSVTTTSNSITLSWDPVTDAVSYNIYRDDELLATNITETSFIDSTVVSGVYYDYHARSVSENKVSNPSMRITGITVSRDITPLGLTAEMNGSNVVLNWTGYEGNQSFELHYATEPDYTGWNADEGTHGTYWGQRYPADFIASFVGMEISKISCCFYYASSYTLYAFNGGLTASDKLCEQSCSKSSQGFEWIDFNFSTPLQIDCTKDLWIVFYNNDSNASWPALTGYYNGINASEGKYIAATLEDLPSDWMESDVSWLIRTHLTDGTYTYSIYEDGTPAAIGTNIAETNYTISNPSSNTIHHFTVKTNYYGGESEASNTASLALGLNEMASLTLENNDNMTVGSGSTLTVTGALNNSNPANLILENGAQLIHSSNGVKATVKKAIVPYSGNDNGWNFIASPVAEDIIPNEENGLLSVNYDLYFYEEPSHMWRNYKEHIVDGINQNTASGFDLTHKKGYLYANEATTTLQFEGTLTPSNNSVTITGLSHENTELNGFNLVGNPFACNATIDKDFYEISGNSITMLAPTARQIAPCEGVMVKADSDQSTATFTKANSAKSNSNSQCLDLVVFQDKATLDRARVRFGNGTNMEKFNLDNEHTQISFWNNGHDFAVAYMGTDIARNVSTEPPINFKAAENGTYSIGIEHNSLDVDYLHLIDNMTGDDIDLLAASNYTFTAKSTDYASRFRLVFAPTEENLNNNDAPFAFVSNGEIVVVGDAGTASLQVVDMTGRVVVSVGGHTRCVPTTGIPAGVYVLRLIDGDNVRTQKIVIE